MPMPVVLNFTASFVGDGVSSSGSIDIVKDPVFFFTQENSGGTIIGGLSAHFDIGKNKPSAILGAGWSLSGTVATFNFGSVFNPGIVVSASGQLVFS